MEKKKPNQKYHYITHRILQDLQHRCIQRTAPEETNLAANWHEHDCTNAEFIRTYMNQDFVGGVLLKRLDQESKLEGERSLTKKLPEKKKELSENTELYLRCFDDVYGFRAMCEGFGKNIYYLSPWEFLMLWECLPLPQPKKGNHADKDKPSLSVHIGEEGDFGPNPAAESKEVIFFPEGIPGPHKLRSRWYLRRRRRPMVPRPTNTRMPDQEKDAERRSKLYSLYLRPWTLHSGKFFFVSSILTMMNSNCLVLVYLFRMCCRLKC